MIGPSLPEWAIGRRFLVVYFMLAALLASGLSFVGPGRNEDPAFTFRTMVVQAAWPGATLQDTGLQSPSGSSAGCPTSPVSTT